MTGSFKTGSGRLRWLGLAVLALAALASVLAWQRMSTDRTFQSQKRLQDAGLITVVLPEMSPYLIASVDPVTAPGAHGLDMRYMENGDVKPDLQLLQLNARAGDDLCAVLARADAVLTAEGRCEAHATSLSVRSKSPADLRVAEGALRTQTLAVLVANPADYTPDELRVRIDNARLTTAEDLDSQVGR